MYHSKDGRSGQETNQGKRVVLDLVEVIENSGQNFTCDNFFTVLLLARKPLQKKLTLIDKINKEKQAGTSDRIYSDQMTECEEHSLRFSTRRNDCIAVL